MRYDEGHERTAYDDSIRSSLNDEFTKVLLSERYPNFEITKCRETISRFDGWQA